MNTPSHHRNWPQLNVCRDSPANPLGNLTRLSRLRNTSPNSSPTSIRLSSPTLSTSHSPLKREIRKSPLRVDHTIQVRTERATSRVGHKAVRRTTSKPASTYPSFAEVALDHVVNEVVEIMKTSTTSVGTPKIESNVATDKRKPLGDISNRSKPSTPQARTPLIKTPKPEHPSPKTIARVKAVLSTWVASNSTTISEASKQQESKDLPCANSDKEKLIEVEEIKILKVKLEDKEKENIQLSNKITELSNQNDIKLNELESSKLSLLSQLQEKQSECFGWKMKYNEIQDQIQINRSENKPKSLMDSSCNTDDTECKTKDFEKDIQIHKDKEKELANKLEKLSKEYKELESNKSMLENEIQEWKTKEFHNSHHLNELLRNVDQLKTVEMELHKTQSLLESSLFEVHSKNEKISKYEQDIQCYQSQLQVAQQELGGLINENQAQVQGIRQMAGTEVRKMDEEINLWKSRSQDLSNSLEHAKNEIAFLKTRNQSESMHFNKTVDEHQYIMKEKDQLINALKLEGESSQRQLIKQREELNDARSKYEFQESELLSLRTKEQECNTLKDQVSETRRQMEMMMWEAEAKVNSLKNELDATISSKQSIEDECNSVKVDLNKLRSQSSYIENEIIHLRKCISETTIKYENKEKELATSKCEVDKIRSDMEFFHQMCQERDQTVQQLETKIDMLQRHLDTAQREAKSSRASLVEANSAFDAMRRDAEMWRNKLDASRALEQDRVLIMSNIEKEKERIMMESEKIKIQLESEIILLKEDLRLSKIECTRLNEMGQFRIGKKEELERELKNTQDTLSHLKGRCQQLEKDLKSMTNKVMILEEEKQKWKAEKELEMFQLLNELGDRQSELLMSSTSQIGLEDEVKKLRQYVEEVESGRLFQQLQLQLALTEEAAAMANEKASETDKQYRKLFEEHQQLQDQLNLNQSSVIQSANNSTASDSQVSNLLNNSQLQFDPELERSQSFSGFRRNAHPRMLTLPDNNNRVEGWKRKQRTWRSKTISDLRSLEIIENNETNKCCCVK